MDDLTREQQKLLTSMYKEVLIRQPAVSFDEANYFANSDVVMDHFCPDSDSDHVSSLCWSLASAGYITCEPGEDLANESSSLIRQSFTWKTNLKMVLRVSLSSWHSSNEFFGQPPYSGWPFS